MKTRFSLHRASLLLFHQTNQALQFRISHCLSGLYLCLSLSPRRLPPSGLREKVVSVVVVDDDEGSKGRRDTQLESLTERPRRPPAPAQALVRRSLGCARGNSGSGC